MLPCEGSWRTLQRQSGSELRRRSHVGSGPCSGRCRGFCGGGCALDLVFGVMKTQRVVSPRVGPCSVDAADSVAAVVPSPASRERLSAAGRPSASSRRQACPSRARVRPLQARCIRAPFELELHPSAPAVGQSQNRQQGFDRAMPRQAPLRAAPCPAATIAGGCMCLSQKLLRKNDDGMVSSLLLCKRAHEGQRLIAASPFRISVTLNNPEHHGASTVQP